MPTEEHFILGAGGHAKVVLDACRRAFPGAKLMVRDDDAAKEGRALLGVPIESPIGRAVAGSCHVAIGDNAARRRLGEAVLREGGSLIAVVHPGAHVSDGATIGAGAFVAAAAVIAPLARVGRCAIVNHGAVVDHDCEVGDWTHVAPGAVLGGAVHVGEECLIGSGAVVLPGVRLGDRTTVGSGAVVTRDVPSGRTVLGVPARRR
jgi:sugar O-acyltransferase (sialic acid O-acetyltransferase NeuD family)